MMDITKLIVLALLVESIWQTVKMIVQKGKPNLNVIGALFVGILMSVLVQANILDLLEFNQVIPYVGYVLTGILISRGSNFIHDLIDKIGKTKTIEG